MRFLIRLIQIRCMKSYGKEAGNDRELRELRAGTP